MPRTRPLTLDELALASARLQAAGTLDELSQAFQTICRELMDNPRTYFYWFYEGHIGVGPWSYVNIDADRDRLDEALRKLVDLDPLEIHRQTGRVHHLAELYAVASEAGQERLSELAADSFRLSNIDYQLSSYFFEDEVFVACAGMGRRHEEGDFTAEDIRTFEALYPYLESAIHACCQNERRQHFGQAIADAVECHPRALLLWSGERLAYANREARRRMQQGPRYGAAMPYAGNSRIVEALAARLDEPRIALPDGGVAQILAVGDWPEQNLEDVRIVLLDAVEPGLDGLTARERELLATLMQRGDVESSAEALGVTVATARTHLKHIYRKLGVSGMHEAFLLFALGRGAAANQESDAER